MHRQDAGQRAARLHDLQRATLLPGRRVRGMVQRAQRKPERQLKDTHPLHVAGDAEDLRPAVALGADGVVELQAPLEQERDRAVGLHVVHVGRLSEHARVGREGRANARHAPFVVQRGEQPRLFAADVGAGAPPHLHVEAQAAPQDALAQQAALARLLHRPLHALDGERVLVSQVDEAIAGAGRVARDQHPLDHRVRVALHQDAVDEGARVALIGVADKVLGFAGLVAQEPPLRAGREVGAAPAAQCGVRHLLDHLVLALLQRLGQPAVAARGDVVIDVLRIDDAAAGDEPPVLDSPVLDLRERRHAIDGRPGDGGEGEVAADARGAVLFERLVHQLRHLVRRHVPVEYVAAVRLPHLHQRLQPAEAAIADDPHVHGQAALLHLAAQRLQRLVGAGGQAAGGDRDAHQRPRRPLDGSPGRFSPLPQLFVCF